MKESREEPKTQILIANEGLSRGNGSWDRESWHLYDGSETNCTGL